MTAKQLFPFASNIRKEEIKFLMLWSLAGLILHLISAWYSQGFYHYDEHYQLLEFAGYKAAYTTLAELPWEYKEQIRPTLQPAIALGFIRLAEGLHMDNPFGIARALRIISGIIGWWSSLMLIIAALPWFRSNAVRKGLIVFNAVFWLLIFHHVRYSSESWAGTLAFAAMAIMLNAYHKYRNLEEPYKLLPVIYTGLLLGFSFVVRFQSGLLFPGFFLWMLLIGRVRFPYIVLCGIAALSAIGAGVVIDRLYYGNWVLSAYKYFEVNLMQGKAAEFGTEPWWWYIKAMVHHGTFPFKLIILLAVIAGIIRAPRSLVVWSCLPFVLLHFAIGHKELRFMFPLISALPVMLAFAFKGFDLSLMKDSTRRIARYGLTVVITIFMVVNAADMYHHALSSLRSYLKPLEFAYKQYPEQKTQVIFTERDPYLSLTGLPMNYYLQGHLIPKYAVNTDSIITLINNCPYPSLVLDKSKGFEFAPEYIALKGKCHTTYTGFPQWLKKANINNWAGRTTFWKVYSCGNN